MSTETTKTITRADTDAGAPQDSVPQGNAGDSSALFRAVLISGDSDSRLKFGRFMPSDPTWSYWTALDAAYEYLDAMYPRWQCVAASREFYPQYVRIDFVTGER